MLQKKFVVKMSQYELILLKEHTEQELSFNLHFNDFESRNLFKIIKKANKSVISTNYHIGAHWLLENEKAVLVEPKVENLDFVKLFWSAIRFSSEKSDDYFVLNDKYSFSLDKKKISVPTSFTNSVSLFLVIIYLFLLKKIARKGIKKGYIRTEQNLKLKIKGKINYSKTIHENHLKGKFEKTICSYSELTENIPENRLLKRALNISSSIIRNLINKNFDVTVEIKSNLDYLKRKFSKVSDDFLSSEINSVRQNKIYSDYAEAMKIAKVILKTNGYSPLKNSDVFNLVFPFWIDMSAMFEMYVYEMLENAYPNTILFQVEGFGNTRVDFIKNSEEEKVIIDTKYKLWYKKNSSELVKEHNNRLNSFFRKNNTSDNFTYFLEDIRQISGYARDSKILNYFHFSDEERRQSVPCIIIYPIDISNDSKIGKGFDSFDPQKTLIEQAEKIDGYDNFYKIGVYLPTIGKS